MAPRLPLPGALASPFRAGLEWANNRPDLVRVVRSLRQALPGDANFGDPYSTAGNEPAQLVGRRLWAVDQNRWSAVGETGLAFLQVAEWAARREQARGEPRDVAIVFTDLVAFSSWALEAGDERALELLRQVGAVVEGTIENHDGRVVKRLGDGVMAVFAEPPEALAAMKRALERVATLDTVDFRPRLRAGLHMGRGHRLGGDYLGIDVNVASRICEDANEGEALISRPALDRLDGAPVELHGRRKIERPGVPEDLEVFVAALDGYAEGR